MGKVLKRGAWKELHEEDRWWQVWKVVTARRAFKYEVTDAWEILLDHDYGNFDVHHQRYDMPRRDDPFFSVRGSHLTVHPGYRWDGCSGPTVDTEGNMAPGLAHDCLYQSSRLRYIPYDRRKDADEDFRELLESEGWGAHSNRKTRVGRFFGRTWGRTRKGYYYGAVRVAGRGSAKPKVPEGWSDAA